ncbi:MAG: helix-turn-helix domain-containing protein, partial [Dehalococcoidia bacterium]
MEHRHIRELRTGLGLSQERFAQLLSVSLQTVRRWESGLTRPLPIISLKLEEIQRETGRSQRRIGGIPMKEARGKGEAGAELGLGGLFKGIGSLIDLVSKMTEEGEEETTRTGEIEALGGKLKGVYGFSIRTGLGGRPVIEQFGNIQETASGAVATETREPLVDVLDEGDSLVVIAELPGVEQKDIQLKLEGDILEITASTRGRNYQK